MKKLCKTMVLGLLLSCFFSAGARAIDNDMLKVGLKYGSDAMFSANLQNYDGAGLGYEFGWFDGGRSFMPLGAATDENRISVTADDNVYISAGTYNRTAASYSEYIGAYHLQLTEQYTAYGEAAEAAARYAGGFVAYLGDRFTVRVGQYRTREGVERALSEWTGEDAAEIVSPSGTGVMVTVTGTDRILFYFDCGGQRNLAVSPRPVSGEKPVTWFRGFRYYGAFEYKRALDGNLTVINVVNIEDYLRGVIGWEIGTDKPLEAIKAQAVAARTYAATRTRHRMQGFDVCATDDCQVYQGLAASSALTDRAVDETAGVYVYYNGSLAETYFYSSNGGAGEDAKNVWGNEVAYLKGKADPYEALVAARVDKYDWSTTYTKSELAARLAAYGYNIGTVNNVYVSEYTPNGNVYALTFVGSSGTRTVYRETCRTILNLRSLRFHIGDADANAYYVNGGSSALSGFRGVYTISGGGTVSQYGGSASDAYVVTSSGVAKLQRETTAAANQDTFTISGSGWGHSVGMSQWGAVAMAEQGMGYRDILQFYYTGVEVR